MSTNNDASQTLFRMVSLRNPQLTETRVRNFGFIQRPKGSEGVFDQVVNDSFGLNKIYAMDNYIKGGNFESHAFKSEKDLEEGEFNELLIIGRKIAKNEVLNSNHWKYAKTYYANLIDSVCTKTPFFLKF